MSIHAAHAAALWSRYESLPERVTVHRARFRSSWAMARTGNVAHIADGWSLLVTIDGRSVMVATWTCGSSTYDGIPVPDLGDIKPCAICAESLSWPSGPVVYRCFDADDRLIYIGSSVRLPMRVVGHRSQTPWWSTIDRLEVEPYPDELTARRAEAAAIHAEAPLHNRRGQLRPVATATLTPPP